MEGREGRKEKGEIEGREKGTEGEGERIAAKSGIERGKKREVRREEGVRKEMMGCGGI